MPSSSVVPVLIAQHDENAISFTNITPVLSDFSSNISNTDRLIAL